MSHRSFRLPLLAGLLLAAGPAFALNAGPEPYMAADPVYTPMTKEPVIATSTPDKASLGTDANIQGPAAGPEPYSAADPVYPAMAK